LSALEKRLHRRFSGIDAASLERLTGFDWPGNVRQLHTVLEQSAILCDAAVLHVPPDVLQEPRRVPAAQVTQDSTFLAQERRLVEEALTRSHGRVSGRGGAAERLGVPPSTLESKIKRLQISKIKYRFGS